MYSADFQSFKLCGDNGFVAINVNKTTIYVSVSSADGE